jgi:hypothetical protein
MNHYSYRFNTRRGPFVIKLGPNGWMIWHDGECLDGPFRTAQTAAEELANGHCAWPSFGDPSKLGIPEDISDWYASRN